MSKIHWKSFQETAFKVRGNDNKEVSHFLKKTVMLPLPSVFWFCDKSDRKTNVPNERKYYSPERFQKIGRTDSIEPMELCWLQ